MLHVIAPHPFKFCVICASVDAKPIAFVGLKLALVHVSIGVPEGTATFGLVLRPVALVAGAVRPYLDAEAVADPLVARLVPRHCGGLGRREGLQLPTVESSVWVGQFRGELQAWLVRHERIEVGVIQRPSWILLREYAP